MADNKKIKQKNIIKKMKDRKTLKFRELMEK
jgi:hypothetical protein